MNGIRPSDILFLNLRSNIKHAYREACNVDTKEIFIHIFERSKNHCIIKRQTGYQRYQRMDQTIIAIYRLVDYVVEQVVVGLHWGNEGA